AGRPRPHRGAQGQPGGTQDRLPPGRRQGPRRTPATPTPRPTRQAREEEILATDFTDKKGLGRWRALSRRSGWNSVDRGQILLKSVKSVAKSFCPEVMDEQGFTVGGGDQCGGFGARA